jgi:hypothetical protein
MEGNIRQVQTEKEEKEGNVKVCKLISTYFPDEA